jgi:hypothetical protein
MTGETVPAEMVVPRFLGGGEIGFVRKPVREPGRGQLLIGVRVQYALHRHTFRRRGRRQSGRLLRFLLRLQ